MKKFLVRRDDGGESSDSHASAREAILKPRDVILGHGDVFGCAECHDIFLEFFQACRALFLTADIWKLNREDFQLAHFPSDIYENSELKNWYQYTSFL